MCTACSTSIAGSRPSVSHITLNYVVLKVWNRFLKYFLLFSRRRGYSRVGDVRAQDGTRGWSAAVWLHLAEWCPSVQHLSKYSFRITRKLYFKKSSIVNCIKIIPVPRNSAFNFNCSVVFQLPSYQCEWVHWIKYYLYICEQYSRWKEKRM